MKNVWSFQVIYRKQNKVCKNNFDLINYLNNKVKITNVARALWDK